MARNQFFKFYIFLALTALLSSCKPNGKENKHVVLQDTQTIQFSDTNNNISHLDTINIIDVTATELTAAYVANEVKADHDYKGKQIIVSGEITDIKKGIADDIYVVLKGSEKHRSVQCYYADEKDAQTLKKGMEISFKGKCDGLWVNVILKECERMWEPSK